MEERDMRKEIIRSLVLWPAFAVATVVAAVWFGEFRSAAVDQITARWGLYSLAKAVGLWPLPDRATPGPGDRLVTMGSGMTVVNADVFPIERAERGTRAMKLPARLEDVYHRETAAEPVVLVAPHRIEQHETAGLVLQPPGDFQSERDREAKIDEPEGPRFFSVSQRPRRESETSCTDSTSPLPPTRPVSPDARSNPPIGTMVEINNAAPFPEIPAPLMPASQPGENLPIDVTRQITDLKTRSLLPKSISVLGKLAPHQSVVVADAEHTLPSSPKIAAGIDSVPIDRIATGESPASWPVTQTLDEQLRSLIATSANGVTSEQFVSSSTMPPSELRPWTEQVQTHLAELRSLPRIGHPAAGELIESLSDLAELGLRQAEQLADRNRQIEWLKTSHAIARRTAIWKPIWELSNSDGPGWIGDVEPHTAPDELKAVMEQLRSELEETGDVNGWTKYLLLEELESLQEPENRKQRQLTAQRFLSRLQWHGLAVEHERWLSQSSVTRLAELVKPWASGAVDYASLLAQIERQESNAIDLAAIDITGAVQSLRFAENPRATRVATALDTHYRNANIRTAISEAMLQRVLPAIDPRKVPVRTNMLGSQVRGLSQIEGTLDVDLQPAADRWSLRLQTIGQVQSTATGVNGPVAVHTRGKSDFIAETPIDVTAREVWVGKASAKVDGFTRLRGIQTKYDGWPLIGSLVRGYAESRYQSSAPTSNRITNRKIRHRVTAEMQTEVDQQVDQASKRLHEMILGPLGKLRLDPKVIDLQTTDERLLARYRLAGDWQLGAFTPRPRAPSSSLMSLQVHQSAINNTLEQLVPRDELRRIRDIVADGMDTFGIARTELPSDVPDDVKIQFSRTRPITIEVEDDQLWITLRIVRMTRDEHLDLRRFIVRALYRPAMRGLHAEFIRDGHLRISGPGMSMRQRLPVRAIFNKVLSPNRALPLTLPQLVDHPAASDLAVSQLELRDGWIALAISEAGAPKIALNRR